MSYRHNFLVFFFEKQTNKRIIASKMSLLSCLAIMSPTGYKLVTVRIVIPLNFYITFLKDKMYRCPGKLEKKGTTRMVENTVFDLISAHFPISAQYDNV